MADEELTEFADNVSVLRYGVIFMMKKGIEKLGQKPSEKEDYEYVLSSKEEDVEMAERDYKEAVERVEREKKRVATAKRKLEDVLKADEVWAEKKAKLEAELEEYKRDKTRIL